MSLSQNDSACEQPAAEEPTSFGLRPERRPVPFPEGPPLMSLFAAALISFMFLTTASWTMFPILTEFLNNGGGLGPLALPTSPDTCLGEALIGTALPTIISLTILLAERRNFRFPGWLPFVVSFPVAWCLTLPSALELGGSLLAWLAFGAMSRASSACTGGCSPGPARSGIDRRT